ncbi:Zinc finger CCCH domain-containing protein 31 [Abeliophyllum distichum]|uniref:Zinc finger CCCH domain-containing protein 31 n=1 Tax=Abeliophyllum distichum TaxID=126358 RepID=A0ABD1U1R4_9LAMI
MSSSSTFTNVEELGDLLTGVLLSYYDPYVWHTCHLECEQKGETDALDVEDEHLEVDSELRKCVAVPFAGYSDSQTDNMTRNLALIVKEMRIQIQLTEDASEEQHRFLNDDKSHVARGVAIVCFLIHSKQKDLFANSFSLYRDVATEIRASFGTLAVSGSDLSVCSQDDRDTDPESLMRFFRASSLDGCILLMEDTDLHFSSHFAYYYDPSCIISTSSQLDPLIPDPSGIKIFWGLSHPYQTIMSRAWENTVPWNESQMHIMVS